MDRDNKITISYSPCSQMKFLQTQNGKHYMEKESTQESTTTDSDALSDEASTSCGST